MSSSSAQVTFGSIGLVTPVGLSLAASASALRAGISAFEELPIPNPLAQDIFGAYIHHCRLSGIERTWWLLCEALKQCVAGFEVPSRKPVPFVIALPEPERPGQDRDFARLFADVIEREVGIGVDRTVSTVVDAGRCGCIHGLEIATRILAETPADRCIVAAADSLINEDVIGWIHIRGRIKLLDNVDGLIPGEAGVAIEVTRRPASANSSSPALVGIGRGVETVPIWDGSPTRGDGLLQAVKGALAQSGDSYGDLDFQVSDLTGEQYFFRENATTLSRLLRVHKEEFEIWHPSDCIGDTGAAAGGVILAYAIDALRNGYGPGSFVVCKSSSDGSARGAALLKTM